MIIETTVSRGARESREAFLFEFKLAERRSIMGRGGEREWRDFRMYWRSFMSLKVERRWLVC